MERNAKETSQGHPQGDRPGTPTPKHPPHLLGRVGGEVGREGMSVRKGTGTQRSAHTGKQVTHKGKGKQAKLELRV